MDFRGSRNTYEVCPVFRGGGGVQHYREHFQLCYTLFGQMEWPPGSGFIEWRDVRTVVTDQQGIGNIWFTRHSNPEEAPE